jgi:PAS domain S-box-containing protein
MKGKPGAFTRLPDALVELHREVAALKAKESRQRRELKALQKSEAYYRAITQHSSDLTIIVDRMGQITYVNPPVERILGYRPEELIGKSAFDYIIPADFLRAVYDFGRAILAEKDVLISNTFRVRHGDGSERTLEGTGSNLLAHPVVRGFVMNVHDATRQKKAEVELGRYRQSLEALLAERSSELAKIDVQLLAELEERRRMEEALRANEQRFRTLIQKSSDVISILDGEGRFVYNSPAVETLLGHPPESLIGRTCAEFIHPDDRKRIAAELSAVIGGTNTGRPTDFRFRKGNGCWLHLESLASNLLTDPGINGIVMTSRDITERRRAEEERKQLKMRLHRAQKMESLGTLAGGVAHDLNNILGVLVGYSELLLLELPEGTPARRRVVRILQASQRAAKIIEDLLTLARRGVDVAEVVQLNQLIRDYLKTPEFEKLKAYHPQVVFRQQLDPTLLNVKGSPIHMTKTVMNLVSNAAEAIIREGVVEIRTENRRLDRPLPGYDEVKAGDYVVLSVADTGAGISAEDVEKIFEPFYTKKVMGRSGTGLGLAVVWGTVKDHSGYIDVESANGQGSTFTLYFPASREPLRVEQIEIPLANYRSQGESLLVVDDVEEQREMAVSLLTQLGYAVQSVASGEEALACLKENPVDLLVLDMIMDPGIDGLETYRRVLEIRPEQRAVIVSGFSETERVRKALRLGAGAYVKKPYALEQIGPAIREALAKKQRRPRHNHDKLPVL